MSDFKPMLASPADLAALRYPLYASAKLDGIRILIRDGRAKTRKLLDLPNKYVQAMLARPEYDGLDGEIIVGSPTAHDVYRKTNSAVMSHDKDDFDFTFFVFDHLLHASKPFEYRMLRAMAQIKEAGLRPKAGVVWHQQLPIMDRDALDTFEADCVERGYEGVITRDPSALYKFGRSTAKEQIMLKVKRFEDSEAEVLGTVEEMFNGNEAQRDELGRTKRSKAKAGLVGKGTMGALKVRDLKTKVEFEIGTGFTADDRARQWPTGLIVRYKFFAVGVKDKPRHPVYLGERDVKDMS